MHQLNLLEIEPDNLFVNHTVKEIQEIDKRIQIEIEKKRQELRYMVGERYRDVLTAADTIQGMRSSAQQLTSHVQLISSRCCEVQASAQQDQPRTLPTNKLKNYFRSVAIQIKILILIPEIIWTCLDNSDYLKAVQIYLLAIHIHTGLELDTEHNILEKFPILFRLKLSISLFKNRILEAIKGSLKHIQPTSQEASEHLCAYVLLENKSQEEALATLLEFRGEALQGLLESPATLHGAVRAQVLAVVRCLLATLRLLAACFGGGALLANRLQQTLQRSGAHVLADLGLQDTPLMRFVPDIVLEFKPACRPQLQPLPSQPLHAALQRWLQHSQRQLQQHLIKSLDHVTSVKVLHNIREEATKIEVEEGCVETGGAGLQLPDKFTVWGHFLQPLISGRAEQLVCRRVHSGLQPLLDAVSSELGSAATSPLRHYVWSEQAEDGRALAMQTRGFAPSVVQLCQLLDNTYRDLLQDVCLYQYGKADVGAVSAHQVEEEQGLHFYLRQETISSIDKLISHVEEAAGEGEEGRAVSGARVLEAVSQLCPQLEACCGGERGWQQAMERLSTHGLILWGRWLNNTETRVRLLARQHLAPDNAHARILHLLPKWDEIEIEEHTDDKVITSKIRLPSQPSVCLVQLLSEVLLQLEAAVPHTVPKPVHDRFLDMLVDILFQQYESWTAQQDVNQKLAIQFLLDVKFITLVCVRREHKQLVSRSQEICDRFRSKIDPFDLDVFYPHLQNCIKRSILQMQVVFGCLLGSNSQLSSLGVLEQPSAGGGEREPSVLSVSAAAADVWFPLLPVTAPASKPLTLGVLSQPRHAPPSIAAPAAHRTPQQAGFVRSGAAALFADWFS